MTLADEVMDVAQETADVAAEHDDEATYELLEIAGRLCAVAKLLGWE